MAQVIRPGDPLPSGYRGLPEFFEFVNGDGVWRAYNCGQAAACSFLRYHGKLDAAQEAMHAIEKTHPPDNLGGWLGTSRRCVERICRAHGLRITEVRGEDSFREALVADRPVIVMLGKPGRAKILGFTVPVGHWMVAYGFDNDYVYLSNEGRMDWDQFRWGWRSIVPRLIRMQGRGLVLESPGTAVPGPAAPTIST